MTYYNDFLGRSNENRCKQKCSGIFVNIWYILHWLSHLTGVIYAITTTTKKVQKIKVRVWYITPAKPPNWCNITLSQEQQKVQKI